MTIERKITAYSTKHQLLEKDDTIIVGVSGGADSMALLHYLCDQKPLYNLKLIVAHVHHGMRKEADEDRQHVALQCEQLGVPCHVHHCNIGELAKQKGISEEEAGRYERYKFFISLTNGNAKIAVAHNQDDQAETMLMRFFRGADIKGLGGMLPKREQIIRPFLCISRQEVEAYCEDKGIVYKQDHTNFMPIYTRNKIRLDCIPYIKEAINPNIVPMLFEHSRLYQEEEAFLDSYVKEAYAQIVVITEEKVRIVLSGFLKEKAYIQKRICLMAVANLVGTTKDFTLKHIEELASLASKQTGKKISLPYGLVASREYDFVCIKAHSKPKTSTRTKKYCIEVGTTIVINEDISLTVSLVDRKTFEQREENRYTKYIDYDKIKDSLCIRTRHPEDSITLPFGTKKLKKYLIDQKVPRDRREEVCLLADGSQIVWLVGDRLNAHYYVADTTKNILELQLKIKQGDQEGLCYI